MPQPRMSTTTYGRLLWAPWGLGEGRRENNANTIPYPVGYPHESRLRMVVYRAIFGGLLPKGAGRSESGEDHREADSVVQRKV